MLAMFVSTQIDLLQSYATSWTTRENDKPFIEILALCVQPSFRLEFVWLWEYLFVIVDEETADSNDGLFMGQL